MITNPWTRRGLAFLALATLTVSVYAYTVTQSYNATTRTYTFTVVVEATDTALRDFHLKPVKKGQRLKGTQADPVLAGMPPMTMNQWKTSQETSQGGSIKSMTWYTEDAAGGDEQPRDDPIAPNNTVTFSVVAPARHKGGDVYWSCTTDGGKKPPEPPAGGPLPGPVAAVTPSANDETPAPSSATVVSVESTEVNTQWEIYLAASLSQEGNPSTDPLGIGINTNDPIPAAHGINFTQSSGVFGEPAEPELPTALTQLNVGPAPLGYRFYMVLVGRDALGNIDLWSDPIEFTITLD